MTLSRRSCPNGDVSFHAHQTSPQVRCLRSHIEKKTAHDACFIDTAACRSAAPSPFAAGLDCDPNLHVQEVCRAAMAHIFKDWRRIVHLRMHFQSGQPVILDTASRIMEDVTSATASVTDFQFRYGTFLRGCQDNFFQLSLDSRKFSGVLLFRGSYIYCGFWSLLLTLMSFNQLLW